MENEKAKLLAQAHFRKAYKLQLSGNLKGAAEEYKKSIHKFPTAEAHTFLGWAYSFQGCYEEAILECQKAISIDPDFGNPYNDIGAYLIEKGKLEKAIPWLEKATKAKRYDSYCYPYYNLGRIYEQQGKWKKALQYFSESVQRNPDYSLGLKAANRVKALFN